MTRMTVRQVNDAPGVLIHDEPGDYTDVALFCDGLRMDGYFAESRFRDKDAGYESWTFRDVTNQGRDAIIIALSSR